MRERTPREALPAILADHEAARAWRCLYPEEAEPERIEVLGRTHKTAVYRLWGAGPDGGTVVAKRCRAEIAVLERLVYEDLLPTVALPALRCFGWVPEASGQFCWLFLEDAGTEAYSPARSEHRSLAASFLAALHGIRPNQTLRAALPDRSPSHYLRLIQASRKALQVQVDNPVLAAHEAALLRTIMAYLDLMQTRWWQLQRFFEAWPEAVVHGDFVVKNLRLRLGSADPELLVYDWEMAGWGVPAVDLAQSLGKAASPDLEIYGAARRSYGPRVASSSLRRLAAYGNLLRLAAKLFWEALSLQGPTYDYLLGPITKLGGYEPQLAAALCAVNWTAHD
jgi:hypothetical protein